MTSLPINNSVSRLVELWGGAKCPVSRRPSAGIAQWGTRQGCRVSRTGPGMALCGDLRSNAGAREVWAQRRPVWRGKTFWLLLGRLPKVTRC